MTIKHTLSILSHLGGNTLGYLLKDIIGVHVSVVGQILAVFLLKLSLRAQGLSLPWMCFLSCSFIVKINVLESQSLENLKQVTAVTAFTNMNLKSAENNRLLYSERTVTPLCTFRKPHNPSCHQWNRVRVPLSCGT